MRKLVGSSKATCYFYFVAVCGKSLVEHPRRALRSATNALEERSTSPRDHKSTSTNNGMIEKRENRTLAAIVSL
jgi:hypothetical protein